MTVVAVYATGHCVSGRGKVTLTDAQKGEHDRDAETRRHEKLSALRNPQQLEVEYEKFNKNVAAKVRVSWDVPCYN